MTEAVAIIPARGGSKRLPRKNILPLAGRPALHWPVRAARKTGLFTRIIVSTDDEEIAGVAEKAGAEVLMRPKDLAQDTATVAQVCHHVLETLAARGICPEFFCCIYATAVFISPKDILRAYDLLQGVQRPDVVMGVSQFNLQPVQALERQDSGFLAHKWPEYQGMQSQKQPCLLASNGTLYWARTALFRASPSFYPERLDGFQIPWIRAIDLDTPEDYDNACLLAPLLLKDRL